MPRRSTRNEKNNNQLLFRCVNTKMTKYKPNLERENKRKYNKEKIL